MVSGEQHRPMADTRDIAHVKQRRRAHLAAMMDEAGGKVQLGDKLGMNPDYLWQMAKGEGNSARPITDKTAKKIEDKLNKPVGWLGSEDTGVSSHPETLDLAKLAASAKFLEDLFLAKERVFVASDQTAMIASVYDELLRTSAPNLVEMSLRYGTAIDAGVNGERQRKATSAGSNDRKGTGKGPSASKAQVG